MISPTPATPRPEKYPGGSAFGATIRGRRTGAGLTLRKCAEAMGKSMAWLSEVETGQRAMVGADRADFERVLAERYLSQKARAAE